MKNHDDHIEERLIRRHECSVVQLRAIMVRRLRKIGIMAGAIDYAHEEAVDLLAYALLFHRVDEVVSLCEGLLKDLRQQYKESVEEMRTRERPRTSSEGDDAEVNIVGLDQMPPRVREALFRELEYLDNPFKDLQEIPEATNDE